MMDRRSETLAAAFNCAKCGGARVMSTTADFVAAVRARSTPSALGYCGAGAASKLKNRPN